MMATKKSDGTDNQLQNIALAARSGYFVRTARAVYAMVFLLPFIVLYEILVLMVNPQLLNEPAGNVRGAVVSFVWVQNFLYYLGMDTKLAWIFAPVVIIVILLMIQIVSRQSWKINLRDIPVMACECLVFAVPLVILALVFNRVPNQQAAVAGNIDTVITCVADGNQQDQTTDESQKGHINSYRENMAMDLLTGIGAGIYEELIFRLILIGLSMIFFETVLGVRHVNAVIISVVISSVLFSLHHHFVFINGQFTKTADMLTLTRFAFRTVAGIFFAIIFAIRGFGIAAGTHAFYDIIATLLNALLFGQC
ncbi:MAG: CPBP family intramembrane metalloprotease [Sedimentisphaerales bacterium]|nr:CPBP family intramembrane metalloprotease [Sedimentisphaerales bacterium]